MKRLFCFFVLVLLNTTGFAESLDWPQWQGPDRSAISEETGLLQAWPESGPPLAWRIEGIGGGYSAPSIAAGRLYGMSNRGDDEVVWALSEADGKEVWVTRLGPACQEGGPQGKEGPGCSPTVDGDRLYVVGAGGDVACLKVQDGEIVWRRSFVADFGGRIPMWRFQESPLVDGEKVICTAGGEDATLVALDKSTGETIWKSKVPDRTDGGSRADASPNRDRADFDNRPDGPPTGEPQRQGRENPGQRGGFGQRPGGFGGRPGGFGGRPGGFGRGGGSGAGYASAIAIDFEGQRQYVQLTAKTLVGVAASDGKVLWRYDRPANRMGINCSTPIYHDGLVFAASAYNAGGGAVRLSKDAGDAIQAEEVYFSNRMQNHHGGMLVYDGCLYGANGGNGGGYLSCLDFKTGEVLWSDRDAPKGSLTLADRRIFYFTERGDILLIEPNREQYVERGRFQQPDRTRSPAWTHPVIANGKLYIRDQDLLFCYDVKASSR